MTKMKDFAISQLPMILFELGSIKKLASIAQAYGDNVLIVTGDRSFCQGEYWSILTESLRRNHLNWEHCKVINEPSPYFIDDTVKHFAPQHIDVVVGIGGGSALDAAKAIAGLLKTQNSVFDYLEGVGPELKYEGPAVPFIAVPTTAGTGSEATKNAVLSVQGEQGFKKSFRDERLVAKHAIIDANLLKSCPPSTIAANGMDALTQLLESYVSLKSNLFTDALALSGLEAVRDSLLPWYHQQFEVANECAQMAYGALLSGITLAQVGLGSVHGLASPLGAFFPIPHGVVCGSLVAVATRVNIESLLKRDSVSPILDKYARLGEVLSHQQFISREQSWQALIELLEQWVAEMKIPKLSTFGVKEADFTRIIAHSRGSSMQTNPIVLLDSEIGQILAERL